MEQEYKTIIIGAGPAGLVAGKNLKEDFLILDKKKEIGEPVQCGEGISDRALKSQNINPDASWISCKIHKAKRIMPNGKFIGTWHKEPLGYIIDRVKFEKYLAAPIIEKIKLSSEVEHLEFRNNYWYVFLKNRETFKCKYLIGADGFNSIVRRKIFPENQNKIDFHPAIEYLVELEKELITSEVQIFFDNEKYNGGYAWIFPKSKKTANIGVGATKTQSFLFDEFLNNYVKNNYGNYKFLKNKSGVVPVANTLLLLEKNNVLLIGDAGGLADPLFKGGMTKAIVSAKIAAECINKNMPQKYSAKINCLNLLGKDIFRASKIFNSLDNGVLNELGNLLEERGTAYLKTSSGIKNLLLSPILRKKVIKIFLFFNAWWKNRDYLW